MGRAKLNMELIRKEKSRHITFKKRKEGLMRKIHEFTTLCDVNACMIIYGPKQENSSMEAEIWPENPDEISRMINIYKAKSKDSATRVVGLSDFFHERKKRMEDELDKLRKKNLEIKYPTWIDPMSHLTEIELRKFAATLSNKLEAVNSRIESVFQGNDHHQHLHHNHVQNRYLIMEGSQKEPHQIIDFAAAMPYNNNNTRLSGLIQRGVELELMNQQVNIPAPVNPMHVPMIHFPAPTVHDQEHHHQMHAINQNSMMRLLTNENDHCHQVQFGCSASSIQCASYKYYESTAGAGVGGGGGIGSGRGGAVLDNMGYNHPRPHARYYGPTVPPMVPYVQYPHLMPNVSPQMQSSRENECNDIIHHRMKDQKPPRH